MNSNLPVDCAALAYAHYGIPVFPCNWIPNENGDLKKYPMPELGKGGLYLATVDAEQIRKWWTRWPLALIGMPGGRRTGVWFVDVDSMEGKGVDGLGHWNELTYYDSTRTRAHITGTKGLHFIYKWNADRFVGCPTPLTTPLRP
jgi:hypothetical protein